VVKVLAKGEREENIQAWERDGCAGENCAGEKKKSTQTGPQMKNAESNK